MSRPLRIQYPGAVYHIMNRGRSRRSTFVDDSDYRAFLDTLVEAHRLWGIEVFAYSLMRNHYHLCLRTPKGNLSRIMRHIDGIYTQRFNRRHKRDGTLFRGRYKAILIDADEYLAAVVRYVHLNAVEAGLVKMPEEHRWASHQYYLKSKGIPSWLDTREAIEQIGGTQVFHEFVLSGNEPALRQYYDAKRQNPILGSETFRDRVRQRGQQATREHPRYERRVVQSAPDRVIQEVMDQYKVTREEIFSGVRGRQNEARKVALYLTKRCCDRTLPEISQYFGIGSYSTVSWSCRTVTARMSKETNFRDRVERIVMRISQFRW
ncbi:MAG TPA: transposase [Candidatus Binatia bacterium]